MIMNVQAISNDQARQALAQILRSPEFRQSDPWAWLGDLWRRLCQHFGWHGAGLPTGGIGYWLLAAVLVGLVLAIYLARTSVPFWRVFAPEVREGKTAAASAERPSPAGLLAAAEREAAAGNFRAALRDLYLSLLLEMEGRGVVSCRAAKTNREYLREIGRKAAGLEQPFRSLVNLFEFKWYGLENCSEADFRTGRDLYAVLIGSSARG